MARRASKAEYNVGVSSGPRQKPGPLGHPTAHTEASEAETSSAKKFAAIETCHGDTFLGFD
jgi:hypothetical protein